MDAGAPRFQVGARFLQARHLFPLFSRIIPAMGRDDRRDDDRHLGVIKHSVSSISTAPFHSGIS
jgi:hypothetical protein